MDIAVIQFPGSNCDEDARQAFASVLGVPARLVWHKAVSLGGADAVVLPGGFSYGDYLRCGAIARFSPVMREVAAFAGRGGPVLGICNGFQILCEAGLLPGVLVRNACLEFRCTTVTVRVETADAFAPVPAGALLRLPIAHGEGNFRCDEETLRDLRARGGVLLRYADASGCTPPHAAPNGSLDNIAGVRNAAGNVWGMMPHPERAVEGIHPSSDGLHILRAFVERAAAWAAA